MKKLQQGHTDLFRIMQYIHPDADAYYADAIKFIQKEQHGGDNNHAQEDISIEDFMNDEAAHVAEENDQEIDMEA